MASLFGHGNPLATPVGQLIERGTDGSQASENWGMYMEVCDIINETDEGPKDAIRAIKKRLSQNVGKNHTAILYTLTCLETCVKNCGKRFHIQVATKDFLGDLIKIIGPKYDPPQAVQEKVLSLIQTWADAFRGVPELKEVEKYYQDLKSKGIEFPMTDLDHMAPIHTPARSLPETENPPPTATSNRSMSGRSVRANAYLRLEEEDEPEPEPQGGCIIQQPPPVPVMPQQSGPVNPSSEQLGKLHSELDVVQGNIRVMGEMLTELNPSSIDQSDLELLQELNRTNHQMQQRLVELLDKVANEEVTNELLRINDDMNNVFLRYERFERYRTGQSGPTATTQQSSPETTTEQHLPPSYDQVTEASNPKVGNLIDLGPDEPLINSTDINTQLSQMSVGAGSVSNTLGQINSTSATNTSQSVHDDDFDMFAQSRQSFEQNKQTKGSGAYSNQQEDQFGGAGLSSAVNYKTQSEITDQLSSNIASSKKLQEKESDYDEMEAWLKTQEQQKNAQSKPQDSTLSSSEFDSFLAERANAADTLPSISAATGGQQSRSTNRKLQKDEEENPLFAL